MLLTVLGCSGSGPGPNSPSSGYLLQAGGVSLAMDLGNGTLGALQRYLDPFALDGLLLSHLHADHCADVASLVVYRRYHPRPPFDPTQRRLPVHAPGTAADRLADAYATSAAERVETDLTDVLDFHPLVDGAAAQVAGCTVAARTVDHPVLAYALRVEHGGRSLAYSGDTGPCDGLIELARDVDVLLCEASWPHRTQWWDEPARGLHLSGRQAGQHATAAGARRLLLTHVPVWFEGEEILAEARETFDGPVELVVAGAAYQI